MSAPALEGIPLEAPAESTMLPNEELFSSASSLEDCECLNLHCPAEDALEIGHVSAGLESWGLPFRFLAAEEWQAEAKDGAARTISMSPGLSEFVP